MNRGATKASARYFTLTVRENGRWSPQFGDGDRSVVQGELDDYLDHGHRRRDLKVIETTGDQRAIDATVANLNAAANN